MYEQFFGLKEKPFSLTPNPRYVYYSRHYRAAEEQLLYGISQKEGFMVLTGMPGTGKTTLCRDLLEKLSRDKYRSALIFNPFLNGIEMIQALLTEFGVPYPADATRKELLDHLNRFLLEQLAAERICVAIFDEAQHHTAEFLEQIRVLSNLETEEEKLIQIVLVGQPELMDRIRAPGMAQLHQRVSVRCTLSDLSPDETGRYIQHRLNVAGARGRVELNARAMRQIHKAARGVPRLINLICDRTLLAGFADQSRKLTVKHVDRAIAALQDDEETLDDVAPRRRARPWAVAAAVLGVAATLLAVAVGFAGWRPW